MSERGMKAALIVAIASTLALAGLIIHLNRQVYAPVVKVNPDVIYNGWKLGANGDVIEPDTPDVDVPPIDTGAAR